MHAVIDPNVEICSFIPAGSALSERHWVTSAKRFFQSALRPVQSWSPGW
jgi:hypothetical protein